MRADLQLRNAGNTPQNLVDAAAGTVAGRETTISEMARTYGVTLRTLRFYEDRNLLRPRRVGSARYYASVDRARLEMILKGKQLGFTLTEIADLIVADDGAAKSDIAERLQPAQITGQLRYLERQRREIDEAIALLKATHARKSRGAEKA
jgi:DNA-binding transcriptional MerR regulator